MPPLVAHRRLGLGRLTGDSAELAAALEAYRGMDMGPWLRQVERLQSGSGLTGS